MLCPQRQASIASHVPVKGAEQAREESYPRALLLRLDELEHTNMHGHVPWIGLTDRVCTTVDKKHYFL